MESAAVPAMVPAGINGNHVAIAPEGYSLPMPVQIVQIVQRVKAVKEIVQGVFEKDNHFGEIPGTAKNKDGSAKQVLLKPGFDTLCLAFQFAPEFEKQPESVESDKFINIVYKCRLRHIPTGRVIATGDGSCNSKEEKYRWTTAARKCPACGGEFIRTSKPEDSQGFYCWKKLGGCGATFPKRCPDIENQPEGRKENDNPWNFHNTLTKMAQKRAGMAAIITACGLSSDFTQDIEDLEPLQNAKNQREEPLVDIPARMQQEEPYREQRNDNQFGGEDRPPEAWRAELDEGATRAEDAEFRPAAGALPADIKAAIEDIQIVLRNCKTKAEFQSLTAKMRKQGGAYVDARVTAVFNEAYYKVFPKSTQPAAAPAAA